MTSSSWIGSDTNPYSFLVYSTKAGDVSTMIVEGRLLVKNGTNLVLEEKDVLERARAYREEIVATLKKRPAA